MSTDAKTTGEWASAELYGHQHTAEITDTEFASLRNAIHHARVWKKIAEDNSVEIRRLKEQIARLEIENVRPFCLSLGKPHEQTCRNRNHPAQLL